MKAVDRDPVQPHLLELQLKCTSRDVLNAQCVRYPLNVKNYKDLRVTAFIPPPAGCCFSAGKYRGMDTAVRTGNVAEALCLLVIFAGNAGNSKYQSRDC